MTSLSLLVEPAEGEDVFGSICVLGLVLLLTLHLEEEETSGMMSL